jgi:hypothetical protein
MIVTNAFSGLNIIAATIPVTETAKARNPHRLRKVTASTFYDGGRFRISPKPPDYTEIRAFLASIMSPIIDVYL